MRKITILTFLLFSILSVAFADENPTESASPGALTGRVVDEMGYVLPGATILIEGTEMGDGFRYRRLFQAIGARKRNIQSESNVHRL